MRCSYCQSELEPTTELSVPLVRCTGCGAAGFSDGDLPVWKGDSELVDRLLAVASGGPTACPACAAPMLRARLELLHADLCPGCGFVLLAGPDMRGWVERPERPRPEGHLAPAHDPGPLAALEERGIDRSEGLIASSDRAIASASRDTQARLDSFNSRLDGCGGRIAAFFERLFR